MPNSSDATTATGSATKAASHEKLGIPKLYKNELMWPPRYHFLLENGYLLRERYRPLDEPRNHFVGEAEIPTLREHALDAVRVSDGRQVHLKHVKRSSPEVEIGKLLSAAHIQSDPKNHACPFLDVLEDEIDEEYVIIVMPLLRDADDPSPKSIRECLEFMDQVLEGLVSLHENEIAHRDCAIRNIMMDARPLYPSGWHPAAPFLNKDGITDLPREPSITAVGGVRYYFVDYGLSSHRKSSVTGVFGVENAPELSQTVPYDPYKLDVYILGMLFKEFVLMRNENTHFLEPLISKMTQAKPDDRPIASTAHDHFKALRDKVGPSLLGQRLHPIVDRFGRPVEPENAPIRYVNDVAYRAWDLWWQYTIGKARLTKLTD